MTEQHAAPETLPSRREFFFCYDIRMGNPNGDPDVRPSREPETILSKLRRPGEIQPAKRCRPPWPQLHRG